MTAAGGCQHRTALAEQGACCAAGQFTNLKFQASSLGLGGQWDAIKVAYAAANRALGDIVKVGPHTHCDQGSEDMLRTTPDPSFLEPSLGCWSETCSAAGQDPNLNLDCHALAACPLPPPAAADNWLASPTARGVVRR